MTLSIEHLPLILSMPDSAPLKTKYEIWPPQIKITAELHMVSLRKRKMLNALILFKKTTREGSINGN